MKKKGSVNVWLILLFQIGFFVALFFVGKLLGKNIIWVIVGLALLTGLALFALFFKVALDEMRFAETRGFWRRVLMILGAGVVAIVMLYLYTRFS